MTSSNLTLAPPVASSTSPITEAGAAAPKLSRSQEVAVRSLLEGASVQDAARQAEVTRQTVSRWRRGDPVFRAALAAGWRELRFLTYGRLVGLADQALSALADVMAEAPDSRSRVRAAELILQHVGERLRPGWEEVQDYYLDNDSDSLIRYDANFACPGAVQREPETEGDELPSRVPPGEVPSSESVR